MDNQLLIAEIHARNELWHQRHPHHHNKEVLDKLWDEVAVIVGSTREMARARWKNLKDNYRKELRKLITAKLEGNTEYQPYWLHYEQLFFLKDHLFSRSHKKFNQSELQLIHTDISDNDGSKDHIQKEDISLSPETLKLKRKRANRDIRLNQKKMRPVCDNICDNNTNNEENERSDDYHFFMSLIPFLKNFNMVQKLNVRNKIQQIILDEFTTSNSYITIAIDSSSESPPPKFKIEKEKSIIISTEK